MIELKKILFIQKMIFPSKLEKVTQKVLIRPSNNSHKMFRFLSLDMFFN